MARSAERIKDMNEDRLNNRRCPNCGGVLRWVSKTKGSARPIGCSDAVRCKWAGKYYDSMPIRKRKMDPSKMDVMLKSMQEVLDLQVSGTRAIDKFEDYVLQHPYADPDDHGNKVMKSYISRVVRLQFLQDMLELSDISDDNIKTMVMENEVHMLFPRPQLMLSKT